MSLDALLMAGGRGRRIGVLEKPLLKLKGKYLIDYVLDALKGCNKIQNIYAATSENTKKTDRILKRRGIKTVITPGKGYVSDMVFALKVLGLGKTLVMSSDLPFVSSSTINWIIREYERLGKPSMTLLVPVKIFDSLNLKPSMKIGENAPVGINIVDGKDLNGQEAKLISDKEELAFNINTRKDLEIAKRRMLHANK
jgi:adenosylcobinamide-phosphate guanylyltransferase